MKHTQSTDGLQDLLDQHKEDAISTLIYLYPRINCENFLFEEVISKVQQECNHLSFRKIRGEEAQVIQEELKLRNHPIIILTKEGRLQAVYSGMVGSKDLIASIKRLNHIQQKKSA